MTKNQRVRLISGIYVVTLGVLSAWFLGALAMADPKCTNCSVNLVMWAMPRAEILTGAWFIAGAGYLWIIRTHVATYCSMVLRIIRNTGLVESHKEG